jgi:hypothetical protein
MVGAMGVALLSSVGGCDDGRPSVESSTEEAKVVGKVTIKGKPASGGKIVFDPSNVERKMAPVASAEIAPDGSYSLATLIGDNVVRVEGPEAEKAGVQLDLVPVDVKRGENEIPISLPRDPEGPSKTADPARPG